MAFRSFPWLDSLSNIHTYSLGLNAETRVLQSYRSLRRKSTLIDARWGGAISWPPQQSIFDDPKLTLADKPGKLDLMTMIEALASGVDCSRFRIKEPTYFVDDKNYIRIDTRTKPFINNGMLRVRYTKTLAEAGKDVIGLKAGQYLALGGDTGDGQPLQRIYKVYAVNANYIDCFPALLPYKSELVATDIAPVEFMYFRLGLGEFGQTTTQTRDFFTRDTPSLNWIEADYA